MKWLLTEEDVLEAWWSSALLCSPPPRVLGPGRHGNGHLGKAGVRASCSCDITQTTYICINTNTFSIVITERVWMDEIGVMSHSRGRWMNQSPTVWDETKGRKEVRDLRIDDAKLMISFIIDSFDSFLLDLSDEWSMKMSQSSETCWWEVGGDVCKRLVFPDRWKISQL